MRGKTVQNLFFQFSVGMQRRDPVYPECNEGQTRSLSTNTTLQVATHFLPKRS